MLRVQLCGGLAIEVDGRQVSQRLIGGRQGRLALAYLVLERHRSVSRDELAELLWADQLPESWGSSLSVVLSKLRRVLSEAGMNPATALASGSSFHQLTLPSDAWIDFEVASRAVDAAEAAVQAGDTDNAIRASTDAAAIAAQGFLADDCDWVSAQRERLRELHIRAVHAQAEGHLLAGRRGPAVNCARDALAIDELREASYRLLMRALAASGERAEALRVWERCRVTLSEELGIDPDSGTEAVYLSLLGDAVPTPAAAPANPQPESVESTQLPTGVVTFLLTDIAQSTRLWEADPAAMKAALAGHDQIISAAVAKHGGHLLKTRGEGDSTFSVFASISHAAAAAIELQIKLGEGLEDFRLPLRVRASMHTGEAELRDGDYFGTTVNRTARLRAIAHGGQVLCSQASARLLEDRLPDSASLRGLGSHRLQDLARPETVYQLCHTALPIEFPPLQSLESLPNNLPVQLTSFIGRQQEIAELTEILSRSRLLTLTGSAGCGKTRLAVHLGGELLREYADGVWLIDLAPLADPDLLIPTMATTLGVREQTPAALSGVNAASARPITDLVVDHLRARSALLILDNCEHVLDAAATLGEALLRSCPGLRIIATSREPLGVGGEVTWRARSLGVPLHTAMSASELREYEAVRLFIDRARACLPSFDLTEEDAPAVAQICRRLDGIPLAIELAAARVEVLAPSDLAARLDDRFRVLTGGSRTGLERHQTLRAAVDWSYDALAEAERALLQRLSVFAGGCILEAAEAVCSGDGVDPENVLDLLSHLVAKSLVTMDRDATPARYRMLETIRQYARDKLSPDAASQLRERHLRWCLDYTTQAARGIWGADQIRWFERLEAEEDNLRQAMEWAIAGSDAETALRLVGDLGRFWMVRQRVTEGLRWTLDALSLDAGAFPYLRAQALVSASLSMLGYFGAYEDAKVMALESLDLFREAGVRRGTFWALCTVSISALFQGDLESAVTYGDEAVATAREAGHPGTLVYGLLNRADVAIACGHFDLVDSLLAEALPILRSIDDNIGLVRSLGIQAYGSIRAGDYAKAVPYLEETIERSREIGDVSSVVWALANLGCVALVSGDLEGARARFGQAQAVTTDRGAVSDVPLGAASSSRLATTDAGLVATVGLTGPQATQRGVAAPAVFGNMTDAGLKVAAARADRTESDFLDVFLFNGLAELALETGDYDAAAESLTEAVDRFVSPGSTQSAAALAVAAGGVSGTFFTGIRPASIAAGTDGWQDLRARMAAPRASTVAEVSGSRAMEVSRPGANVAISTAPVGELVLLPPVLAAVAKLAAATGQAAGAAKLFGASYRLRGVMLMLHREGRMILLEHRYDEFLDMARLSVGDDAFEAARAEGEAMSSEDALSFAAEVLAATRPPLGHS